MKYLIGILIFVLFMSKVYGYGYNADVLDKLNFEVEPIKQDATVVAVSQDLVYKHENHYSNLLERIYRIKNKYTGQNAMIEPVNEAHEYNKKEENIGETERNQKGFLPKRKIGRRGNKSK